MIVHERKELGITVKFNHAMIVHERKELGITGKFNHAMIVHERKELGITGKFNIKGRSCMKRIRNNGKV